MRTLEVGDILLSAVHQVTVYVSMPRHQKPKNEAKQKIKCTSVAHYTRIIKSI